MSNHTNWEPGCQGQQFDSVLSKGGEAGFWTAADLTDLNLSLLCFITRTIDRAGAEKKEKS